MKKYSPKTARTFDQICSLRRDNIDWSEGWVLTNEENITIALQKCGEGATAVIEIPKHEFNRIIRWYQRETRNRRALLDMGKEG